MPLSLPRATRALALPSLALRACLAVVVLACRDAASPPERGRLTVLVDGLPASTAGAVTVTGPDGYRESLPVTRVLDDVPAGDYTIEAAEVATTGARWAPSPARQTVHVGANAQAVATPITYQVATARLAVTIDGLPAGNAASVALSGPRGFSRTLGASTQLELLEPGTYTLTASDVNVGTRTFRARPRSVQLVLAPSLDATTTAVQYGPGDGTLDVAITGLTQETAAAVTVTGPGGYTRRVEHTETLAMLEAGRYTVTAEVVVGSLVMHRPGTTTQAVDVVDGATRTASVSYTSTLLALSRELVASGFTQPVFVAAPAGDARLFVVERPGRVRLVVAGVTRATPFLDIRERVNNVGERGLLGIAFDPRYAENGWLYVYYVGLDGAMVLERIASTPGADVASGSGGIVMRIPHGGSEHHGGTLAFGPDGMLYLGPGDGGCCGDPNNLAQNMLSPLGKLLRIDVRTVPFAIPADNPYVGVAGARAEIWASGLRNPWRFSFDAVERRLYIGDVGQDAREEVNVVGASQAGLNFGWRLMEGTACYNPTTNCVNGQTLVSPVLEYLHNDGCSVTSGYVYRGSAMPELTGHYLYADYCRGWVRSFRMSGTIAGERNSWPGLTLPGLLSFGFDGAGELYTIAGTSVYRIVRAP